MKLTTALGIMQAIKGGAANSDYMALGLTPADMVLLTGDKVWLGEDQMVCKRALEACIYGTMHILGHPKYELCAEYIATAIYVYVSPINYLTACVIMESTVSSENIARGEKSPARITPSQMHAYLCQLLDADTEAFRVKFDKKGLIQNEITEEIKK